MFVSVYALGWEKGLNLFSFEWLARTRADRDKGIPSALQVQ